MQKNSEEKYIQIHILKALGILASAVIVSVVGTTFAVVNILNNDHFTLLSLDSTVSAIPDTYLRQDVYAEQQKHLDDKFKTIDNRFTAVNTRLDAINNSIEGLREEIRQSDLLRNKR